MRRLFPVSVTVLLLLGACSSASSAPDKTSATGSGRTDAGTSTSVEGTQPPPETPSGARDLDHVLVTGQSNAVGFGAAPALTATQPFGNLMFDVGVMTATNCDDDGCRNYARPTKLVPLVEGDAYFNYAVETIASGFANEVSKLAGGARQLLLSIHGRSGNSYACLRKGGCAFYSGKGYLPPFAEALDQVADGKALAAAQGLAYAVRAVAVIHGESDHYAPPFPLDGTAGAPAAVQTYADALVEWQRDYDAAIRAASGQSAPVPMLVSQMSNWNDRADSEIPTRQLEAHTRAPGRVVLVAPTYMLPFGPDCIHFTNHGERQLGEYFAKAYTHLSGKGWEPLRPLTATLASDTVTVRFVVPAPPLVLDTARVTDPGNFGFEYTDDSDAPPAIVEVKVSAPDTVTLKLASAPEGGSRHVRYAMRATPYTCPGPQTGPRGNLRDSDTTASMYGYALENWAVHFDMPVQ